MEYGFSMRFKRSTDMPLFKRLLLPDSYSPLLPQWSSSMQVVLWCLSAHTHTCSCSCGKCLITALWKWKIATAGTGFQIETGPTLHSNSRTQEDWNTCTHKCNAGTGATTVMKFCSVLFEALESERLAHHHRLSKSHKWELIPQIDDTVLTNSEIKSFTEKDIRPWPFCSTSVCHLLPRVPWNKF